MRATVAGPLQSNRPDNSQLSSAIRILGHQRSADSEGYSCTQSRVLTTRASATPSVAIATPDQTAAGSRDGPAAAPRPSPKRTAAVLTGLRIGPPRAVRA